MIEIRNLTKCYGPTRAVDRLTVTVRPGYVTGFLGPNGAGKTTTLRLALGLAAPSSGDVLLCGRAYVEIERPMREVGALLDATAIEGRRSAVDHLRWLGRSHRIAEARVTHLLEQVGLGAVARRPIATFSLGMKQRLGIAAALLGDPRILLLDEPINGLDPDGVRWIRELLRGLAAKGGTILISSHLMSEMAITADRLVIVARGRLIADTTVDELGHRYARGVVVRSPEAGALARALEAAGGTLAAEPGGGWLVTGLDATAIGRLAGQQGVPLSELMPRGASLEEAYLQLTAESTDHRAGTKEARP